VCGRAKIIGGFKAFKFVVHNTEIFCIEHYICLLLENFRVSVYCTKTSDVYNFIYHFPILFFPLGANDLRS
jgi:hypothetical protein